MLPFSSYSFRGNNTDLVLVIDIGLPRLDDGLDRVKIPESSGLEKPFLQHRHSQLQKVMFLKSLAFQWP